MQLVKFYLTVLFLTLLDQVSKYIIRHSGGFYICNGGIAFGLNMPGYVFWFIWLAIIIFINLIIFNFQFSIFNESAISKFLISKPVYFGLILILAGAFSNMIDRISYGCVIDFINLSFWPIFNPADIFIALGVILLILPNIKQEHKQK